MVKIYIDAGHGGNDPGASGNGLKEKNLTLDIAKRIKKYLDNNYSGHSIKMSRTTDKTLSLSQRTNEANNWGADYFLSIHINSGGGTGYEDYIYSGAIQKQTASIRDTVHAEVVKQIPEVTNRGKKRANLHVTRESRMPSALTESLFIDTKKDADKLKDSSFLDKLAKGHAIGLAKAFSLKNKSGASSKPSSSKPSKSKSVTQMANEVIAGKHGSGHDNRRKSLGVSKETYEKVRAEVNNRSGVQSKPKGKSISQMATEVINGKHGSGHANRRKSLGVSQSTYNKVRAEVNKRASGGSTKTSGKSISQMANEIINGKGIPNGHEARRKHFGISKSKYEQVRKEVNRRLK